MEHLVSIALAARIINVDQRHVREWARRSLDPLPSVMVGSRVRKVIVSEIGPWLEREAQRQRDQVPARQPHAKHR